MTALLNERYEILSILGQGGMGKVYLVLDRKLNKQWALKELYYKNKQVNKKTRELELAALKNLEHENLPRIVDAWDEEEKSFLVMDYVPGMNLKTYVEKNGRLKDDQVIDIGIELIKTIKYLHERKNPLIYRDLKPSNIIMRDNGKISLVDLGSIIVAGEANSSYAVGTRRFAAPEQYKGEVSELSDIYSFGRTLEYISDTEKQGVLLGAIIKRCCMEEGNERYQSADFILKELIRLKGLNNNRKIYGIAFAIAVLGIIFIATMNEGKSQKTENNSIKQEQISVNSTFEEDYKGKEDEIIEEIQDIRDRAKVYLKEDSADAVALGKALSLLEEEKELIGSLCSDTGMTYRIDNLSMLSTIYRLLGRQSQKNKERYYDQAIEYIEELFSYIDDETDGAIYRKKLADMVSMEVEMGKKEDAMKNLEKWEITHPIDGKELYFSHACYLLEEKNHKKEMSRLYERMKANPQVVEDFRYQNIKRQIESYLEE